MSRTLVLICVVLLLASVGMAQSKAKPLDDAQLDSITAAGFTVTAGGFTASLTNDGKIQFGVANGPRSGMQLVHEFLRARKALSHRPLRRFTATSNREKLRAHLAEIIGKDVVGTLAVSTVKDADGQSGQIHIRVQTS